MARGMVANEPIVSQAQNRAFDEGYDRVFGVTCKGCGRVHPKAATIDCPCGQTITVVEPPKRGRWVWDPVQMKLVRPEERHESRAIDAPIMVDRFYEGVRATDGADIGSRRKRNEYMRAHGLADAGDYSAGWYETKRKDQKRDADRQRRETLERAAYRLHKP